MGVFFFMGGEVGSGGKGEPRVRWAALALGERDCCVSHFSLRSYEGMTKAAGERGLTSVCSPWGRMQAVIAARA